MQSSGIVFSLPTGTEIAEAKYGFNDYSSLDQSSRVVDKDNTSFTFASSGDSTVLGNYTLNNLSYDGYPLSDKTLFANAYWGEDGEDFKYLLDFAYLNPLKLALSTYAYVVLDDGTVAKTDILKGAEIISESNNSGYTMDWSCGSYNMSFAPCIHTRNNAGETANDLTNTSLTLQGRFGSNSATFNTPLTSNGLGFYYSTTGKPDIGPEVSPTSDEYYEAVNTWIDLSTTYKVSVSVTTAMENHMTGQGEAGVQFLEYEKPVTGLTGGSTVYFCAYAIPRQRSSNGLYSVPGLTDTWNRTRFGAIAEKKLPAAHTTPQAGEEPHISIHLSLIHI